MSYACRFFTVTWLQIPRESYMTTAFEMRCTWCGMKLVGLLRFRPYLVRSVAPRPSVRPFSS